MRIGMMAAAAAATAALAVGFAATPAAAALTLGVGEEACDLYSADGCLFTYEAGDGNIFDDPQAYEDAWNGVHDATPPPEVLELGDLTDKFEFSGDNNSENILADFLVSFYVVKAGSGSVILYGLDPATDSFTALSGRLEKGISHVTVFGCSERVCGGGGGGGGVPEPATWAMMIMGFGGIGATMRQRRRQAVRVSA